MVKQFVSNMNLYISYFATSQDQKRKMTCFSSVWHLKSNERINFMDINLEFPKLLMIRKGIFNDFMSYQKSEIQNLLQLFLKKYVTDRIKSDIYIFAELSQAIKSSILLNTAAVKYLWKCNYNYNDLIYYILDMREFTLVFSLKIVYE